MRTADVGTLQGQSDQVPIHSWNICHARSETGDIMTPTVVIYLIPNTVMRAFMIVILERHLTAGKAMQTRDKT